MAEKKLPVRTCISCRNEFNKPDLLRIVKTKDDVFFVDTTGKANGRGAYICKNKECLKKARKQRRIEQSLECSIPDEIYDRMEEEISIE